MVDFCGEVDGGGFERVFGGERESEGECAALGGRVSGREGRGTRDQGKGRKGRVGVRSWVGGRRLNLGD